MGVALLLGRAAVAFVAAQGWMKLGYARASDLARERFGRTSRWLSDLAALGRAVEQWPQLGRALTGEDGARPLGKVAATLIGRVASETTIDDWIWRARRITVRKLKMLIRARANGPEGALSPAFGSDVASETADGSVPAGSPHVVDPDGSAAEACADQWFVSMEAPAAAVAAFDETLLAYRAVVGGEATVASFVEALVGEALSGPVPFDTTFTEVVTGMGVAALEEHFEKASDSWATLAEGSNAPAGSSNSLGNGSSDCSVPELAQLDALAAVAGKGDVIELDQQLRELIRIEDALERRLGEVLSRMGEQGAWSRLRFASVDHYGEQRLGLQRTAVYHRTRLARALRRFPELRKAYEEGAIGQESALIVVRILEQGPQDPEVERAWVERAKEATVKRLRDEARVIARTTAFGGSDLSRSTVFDRAAPALHDAGPEWLGHESELRDSACSTAAPGSVSKNGAEEPASAPDRAFIAGHTGIAGGLARGEAAPAGMPVEACCGETAFGRSPFASCIHSWPAFHGFTAAPLGVELGNLLGRSLQSFALNGLAQGAPCNSSLDHDGIGDERSAVPTDHASYAARRFLLDVASGGRSRHHGGREDRAANELAQDALGDSGFGHGRTGAEASAVFADHADLAAMRFPLDDASWHRSLHHSPGEVRVRVLALCERAVGSSDLDRPSSPRSDGFFKRRLPADLARDFLAAIEQARRALEWQARNEDQDGAGNSAQVRPSLRAARMFSARCRRVPSWVGLIFLLEELVETWDPPEEVTRRRASSAQSIYAREGWRCFAPGCTSRRNLESHHVVYRSHGGELTDPANQVCLCRYHHQRGEHGDLASCRGTAPLGLIFRLGPAASGCSEWFRNERRVPPPS